MQAQAFYVIIKKVTKFYDIDVSTQELRSTIMLCTCNTDGGGADYHQISHRIQIVPNEDSSEKKFSLLIFIISINAILGCSGSEEGISCYYHICPFFLRLPCVLISIYHSGALSCRRCIMQFHCMVNKILSLT